MIDFKYIFYTLKRKTINYIFLHTIFKLQPHKNYYFDIHFQCDKPNPPNSYSILFILLLL